MKRVCLLGMALLSVGAGAQCPSVDFPTADFSCGEVDVRLSPDDCFELAMDPCSRQTGWPVDAHLYITRPVDGISVRSRGDETGKHYFICATATAALPARSSFIAISAAYIDGIGGGALNLTWVGGPTVLNSVSIAATPRIADYNGRVDVHATVVNGLPPFTYRWSPPLVATDDSPDAYVPALINTTVLSVMVTDATGAIVEAFTEVPVRLESRASASRVITAPGDSVQLFANALGGDGLYTYSWSPPLALSDAAASSPIASPPVSTTYTVRVVDGHGQVAVASVPVTVAQSPPLTASFVYRQPGTRLPFDVTLDASTSTGPIVSYEWDLNWVPGAPDLTSGPIATFTRTEETLRGSITLTVRDANGNSATASRPYP